MLATIQFQRYLRPYLPQHRSVPFIYVIRARRLLATNQKAIPAPALSVEAFPLSGHVYHRTVAYAYSYDPHPPAANIHRFVCPGCGRVGSAPSAVLSGPHASTRPVCSHACEVSLRLYYYDCLALSGLPRFNKHGAAHEAQFDPYSLTSFNELFSPPHSGYRKRTTDPEAPSRVPTNMPQSLLAGRFARKEGIFYLSSLLVPIRPMTLAMREVMKVQMQHDEEQAAADAANEPAPASPPSSTLPAPLEEQPPTEIGAAAPPTSFDGLGMDPVVGRASALVLEQLENANAFLNGAEDAPAWDKEKVKLFLGLYQRVTPSLSAQLNINSNPPARPPSEMTREELQAAIEARKPKTEGSSS